MINSPSIRPHLSIREWQAQFSLEWLDLREASGGVCEVSLVPKHSVIHQIRDSTRDVLKI